MLLEEACNAIANIVADGKRVLFVGTKKQAKDVIREEAVRTGEFYVSERWLGGSLTNFTTIRKSVKRLTNIEKMESDGTFDKITKKEGLFLQREKDKLNNVLSGVVDMTRLPGALFVVDVKKEAIAVKEAQPARHPGLRHRRHELRSRRDRLCDPGQRRRDQVGPGDHARRSPMRCSKGRSGRRRTRWKRPRRQTTGQGQGRADEKTRAQRLNEVKRGHYGNYE